MEFDSLIGSARRLNGIEAARGIAATAVVLYHAARHLDFNYGLPLLRSVFQFGHAGVDLFFVISGFIILFIHYDDIDRPKRMPRYVERRFTRIMPIYWLALALTIGMAMGGGHGPPPLLEAFWSATLLPSYHEPLLGVAWTLQYEVIFYAVFCLLIYKRSAGIFALSCWLFCIMLTNTMRLGEFGLPGSLTGAYNLEFFMGMGTAYWLRHYSLGAPRLTLAGGAIMFAVVAGAEDLHLVNGYAAASRLLYGPAAALIILGLAEAERQGKLSVPRLLQTLGGASYSIYLFQFMFIGVVWKLWLASGVAAKVPYASSYPLLAVGAVAGGVAMSRMVEHPLIRLTRRLRRPAPAIAP